MKAFVVHIVALVAMAAAAALVHGLSAPFRLQPAAPEPTVIELPARAGESPPSDVPADAPDNANEADQDEREGDVSPPTDAEAVSSPAADQGRIVLDETEIDLTTARLLFEAAAADFVDARLAAEYEAGHIEGAMHITPDMLLEGIPAAIDFLSPDRPIVVYCGGGDCHDSHLIAERLQSMFSFNRTHVFTGGFPEWEAAGLPIGTGPDPLAEFN